MATFNLNVVDWLILAIYFGFILGLGYYLKRFTKSQEDYFMAGRKNSAWVAGIAFLSANLGALELLGMTGNTFKYGMYVAHFYWVGAIPAMLFLGLYMMPFYYSSRIHSVPGYLKLRFDERTRVLNGIAFGIMTLLVSGINLYAMALVLRTFLGWDWNVSMWVSAATVAFYVTLSGLMSAIFTEIHSVFPDMVRALPCHDPGARRDRGGGPGLEKHPGIVRDTLVDLGVTLHRTAWRSHGPESSSGLGFVLSFGYWTTDFLVVQRAFSAKNLRAARMTPIIASFPKMAVPVIVVLTGLIALILAKTPGSGFALLQDGGQVNYDSTLPLLIMRYYPHGLVGLGVSALLAGFMAGQAGNISAFNTVWTYDVYRAIINKNASDANLMWVGRISTVVGVVLSVVTAYWAKGFPSIMDYMQAIFSWVNAPLFATMLLGMFVVWITPAGAFWGLLAGMGTSIAMFLGVKFQWIDPARLTLSSTASDMAVNFWRAWWAWLVCFSMTILISLFTKKKPKEELVGLVKGLTEETARDGIPFVKRPEFYAILSVIVLVILNIYFW